MISSSRIDAMLESGKFRRLCAAAALLFAFMTPGWAQAQSPLVVFTAVIQPTQEVPPILVGNAFGNGFFTVDLRTQMLCYSISYAAAGAPDLASGETAAHIHGPGRPGVSAGILFDISPALSPVGSPKVGCVGPINGSQAAALVGGLWYINIHSNAYPGGEIRGQLLFERVIM